MQATRGLQNHLAGLQRLRLLLHEGLISLPPPPALPVSQPLELLNLTTFFSLSFCVSGLRWSTEIFHTLKGLLKKAGHVTSVGDEGFFTVFIILNNAMLLSPLDKMLARYCLPDR